MKQRVMKTDQIFLNRFAYLPEGTLGQMVFPGGYECFTIERPWKMNQRYVSCIPEGDYPLIWHMTKGKHYLRPELDKVPDRSAILIHPANYPEDLLGCIGPGRSWVVKSQSPMVGDSQLAYNDIIKLLGEPGTGPIAKTLTIYSTNATMLDT